jgi:hypothetical protein
MQQGLLFLGMDRVEFSRQHKENRVFYLNHPFFFGGSGSGMSFAAKNLSEESSSFTYQKYCAMGTIKEPTTRMARIAVYLPFSHKLERS